MPQGVETIAVIIGAIVLLAFIVFAFRQGFRVRPTKNESAKEHEHPSWWDLGSGNF